MRQFILNILLLFLFAVTINAEGFKIGDKATDFRLKNTDNKYMSLSDFSDAKGFILIFTCNGCPYAQAYQDRLIEIDRKYKPKGYPVIAINSNNTELSPEDNLERMKERAGEKGFTFPYLKDQDQKVARAYGAIKTPHAFVLKKTPEGLIVSYIGAIDDNYLDAAEVREPYLANAVDALLEGKEPHPSFTMAIGCTIKTKN